MKTCSSWKWQTASLYFSKSKNSTSNFKKSVLVVVQPESWKCTAQGEEVWVTQCLRGRFWKAERATLHGTHEIKLQPWADQTWEKSSHERNGSRFLHRKREGWNFAHLLMGKKIIWIYFVLREIRIVLNGVLRSNVSLSYHYSDTHRDGGLTAQHRRPPLLLTVSKPLLYPR